MIESILDFLKVSPWLIIIFVMLIQLFSQTQNIINQNIIASRIEWLAELKKNFLRYNTILSELIELNGKGSKEGEEGEVGASETIAAKI